MSWLYVFSRLCRINNVVIIKKVAKHVANRNNENITTLRQVMTFTNIGIIISAKKRLT